jgi:hypothetical protein
MSRHFTFEISDEREKELETLMSDTGLTTFKELINKSLTLFEWAVQERKTGCVIASVNEKEETYREVSLLENTPRS